MAKRVFIIGNIFGMHDNAFFEHQYSQHQKLLEKAGYSVVNPADLLPRNYELKKRDGMRLCLNHLTNCQAVSLMEDYKTYQEAEQLLNAACIMGLTVVSKLNF
jgi:hypothetical protein